MEDQTEYQIGETVGAKLDSAAAESLTQMAEAAGLYFKSLQRADIPFDLAIRLVEEWHRIQWDSIFRGP